MQKHLSSNQSQFDMHGGVILQEFLFLLAILMGGLCAAAYAAERFGWIGFFLGGVAGLVVSFGALYLFFTLCVFIGGVIWEGIPFLPACGNGKCKSGLLTDSGDYEWELDGQDRVLYRCRCGLLYQRETGRVREVLPDRSTKPYMVWKPFRGWRSAE